MGFEPNILVNEIFANFPICSLVGARLRVYATGGMILLLTINTMCPKQLGADDTLKHDSMESNGGFQSEQHLNARKYQFFACDYD